MKFFTIWAANSGETSSIPIFQVIFVFYREYLFASFEVDGLFNANDELDIANKVGLL